MYEGFKDFRVAVRDTPAEDGVCLTPSLPLVLLSLLGLSRFFT